MALGVRFAFTNTAGKIRNRYRESAFWLGLKRYCVLHFQSGLPFDILKGSNFKVAAGNWDSYDATWLDPVHEVCMASALPIQNPTIQFQDSDDFTRLYANSIRRQLM